MRVYWSIGHADLEEDIDNVEALRELLTRLDRLRVDGLSLMVGIEAPLGSLAVSLGDRDVGTLVYFPAGEGDMSFHSVANTPRANESRAYWTMLGAYSEFPESSLVSRVDIEEAINSFVATNGARPDSIQWEAD